MTAACALLGAMAVGGTMAYLTDDASATNTFTVGSVDIELTEENYPGNEDLSVKNLVPNQEVTKDPIIKNVGTNPAILFMTVDVPVKNVTLVEEDGTKGTKEATELFWFKDSADSAADAANNFDAGWINISDTKGTTGEADGTTKYVFAYSEALDGSESTTALFDKVQLKNVIEGELSGAQDIVVNAYAIQASDVINPSGADVTDDLTKINLEAIYDAYVKQNTAG